MTVGRGVSVGRSDSSNLHSGSTFLLNHAVLGIGLSLQEGHWSVGDDLDTVRSEDVGDRNSVQVGSLWTETVPTSEERRAGSELGTYVMLIRYR